MGCWASASGIRLSRDLAVPVRTYFGVDSRPATVLLAGLTWIPGGIPGGAEPAPPGH
jgi:hypothetical protein